MMVRWRGTAAALCVALATAAGGASASGPADAAGGPLPAVSLNADSIAFDNRGTTLVAAGHVAAAYGTLRVRSDALRIDRPTGTATFSGHVTVADQRAKASAQVATLVVARESQVSQVVLAGEASVETPSYALLADRIVADRGPGLVTAAGHVTVFSKPDVIATGALASYDERADHAVVRGDGRTRAVVQNRDGRIAGSVIEVSRRAGRATVRGPVEAEIYDATLTGALATIDLDRATAVVSGGVTVARRTGTLSADRLTVYYGSKRFVAEGVTHMVFRDIGESSSPSSRVPPGRIQAAAEPALR